jgi:hypothetical protein
VYAVRSGDGDVDGVLGGLARNRAALDEVLGQATGGIVDGEPRDTGQESRALSGRFGVASGCLLDDELRDESS